jgi:hypothetical protein
MFKLTEGKTKGNMRHFDTSKPASNQIYNGTNYFYTVPDSHFWSSLDMFKNYLESEKYFGGFGNKAKLADYILVGVNNMIKQGYELKKKDDPFITLAEMMRELYKLRDKYVGKKFTMYRWVTLIKIFKKYINK